MTELIDNMAHQFIEASAGTGKTYTIEQKVLELVEKENMPLKEILIVTFTNAATFELKERIRKTLQKKGLPNQGEEAIYTIHGFCQKILTDFSFEASFPLDLNHAASSLLVQITLDVLSGPLEKFHPKQLEKLLNLHRQDAYQLALHITKLIACRVPISSGPDFNYYQHLIQQIMEPLDPECFLADLLSEAKNYGQFCDRKKEIKPEYLQGLRLLAQGNWMSSPITLFQPDNRLKKTQPVSRAYPGVIEKIAEIASDAFNPMIILATLASQVLEIANATIDRKEWIFFEDLILRVKKNLDNKPFVDAIANRYRAVIIDEFQDTDPDQWEIFSRLFFHKRPMFLVGDPKQAIYRFRRADIYTYLDAKASMSSIQSLKTNYRSSPALVEGLNYLFSNLTFHLPKKNGRLVYEPVLAGKKENDLMPPIVLLKAESEYELFQKIVQALKAHPDKSAAILVKDRYQAERFKASCDLPLRFRRARSLQDSPARPFVEEILAALTATDTPAFKDKCLKGKLKDVVTADLLWKWKEELESQGVLFCFRNILHEIGSALLAWEGGDLLYQDTLHIAELLATCQGLDLLEAFDKLMQEDEQSDKLKARQKTEDSKIEVMTVHVSKGLEFDLVFPLSLAVQAQVKRDLVFDKGQLTPCDLSFNQHAKEIEAETERQVYVACTRAKKRLYLTVIEGAKAPINALIEGKDFPEIQELAKQPAIKTYHFTEPVAYQMPMPPSPIISFSSLVQAQVEKKSAPLLFPAGAEVGIIIHKMLEKLDFRYPASPKWVGPFVLGSILEPFQDHLTELLNKISTYTLPQGFQLKDVAPDKMLREQTFLYPIQEGYCKGVIDLIFEHQGAYYILDWKTNVIETSIEDEIAHHQYDLQAKLYKGALMKYLMATSNHKSIHVLYYFVRQDKEAIKVF
jgi:exodeoxyribonuclease V beta subunit